MKTNLRYKRWSRPLLWGLTCLLALFMGAGGAKAATLTLSPSQISYGATSGWKNSATFSSSPELNVTASANNMNAAVSSTYLDWRSGTAKSSIYTFSISGYKITGYTITAYASNGNPQTLTPTGGSATTISATDAANAETMTVTGISVSSASFTLAGNNQGLFITQITIDYIEDVTFAASDVVTILNNKASNRGALTYEPSASTTNVWSSYKSGATALDATNPNHQWVLYPTGTTGQYYLYNVGADKFAVPTAIEQKATNAWVNAWVFSDNAVAVSLLSQTDGTYRIKMAADPVSGTNQAVISANSDLTNPIFNYNDTGSDFTITKVTGDAHTAAEQKVAKLVKSQTALTSYPQTSGWYVLQIASSQNNSNHAGRYVYPTSTLYNSLYPLTFTGAVDVQPAITDATYLMHFDCTSWNNNYWQLPDGRYLVYNANNKFPTVSNTPGVVYLGYDGGTYIKSSNNYYADAYNDNANYYIGETTTFRTKWTVYPINLSTAGLQDWRVTITTGSAPVYDQTVSCTRSDVAGLTSVYTGGTFFLPTGVTPSNSDFSMPGSRSITVNASDHTVTVNYDPNIAIVESGVSVTQGFQTAGRNEGVMLLRVTAEPFKDATNASISVSLKDGTESQISALTLYEASSASSEVLTIFNSDDTDNKMSTAPTLTSVNTVAVSGATATLSIDNLTAGTHYYWIAATVKADATLGSVLDAAVTGITYTCNSNETTLDLTSTGDPADRGAMVFNTRTYPFLPSTYDSRVYRIPAMVVANDGSIIVAADKRYDSFRDIGGGHVIDIVIRRSTDGGRTWSTPVTIAKGDASNDATCGYGDPSLYKDNDGKIYCLFGAGNIGYFYGLNRICLSTSTDNGVTWSSSAENPPADLVSTGHVTDHATSYGSNTCYGLYDYFVTSGRGICTTEGYIMGLLPAQPYTDAEKTAHTQNSQDYIFYSTDQGATWHISENAIFAGGDEAKVTQMNDGSLLASVRQGYNRGFNTATYTYNTDGTLSFTMGTQWNNSQLSQGGYANNQDIFYYQRSTLSGKTDVIFQSLTTGQHANLKLYYSLDQGQNWTEFLNLQTKGTRYVTLEKSGTDAAPGSLYLLFEDQSLNSAGGYTDYNHYPLNFVEITREQLVALIPALDEDYVANPTNDVKVVYGTTSHTIYGSIDGDVWTSNASSGMAGVTLTKSNGNFNQFSNWNSHFNLAYAPATNDVASTLTLAAPAGYAITGYNLLAAKAYSATHTYTLKAEDGTTITPAFASSATGYTTLSMTGLSTQSTSISVTSTDVSKYVAIADFTISLRRAVTYNQVDGSGNILSSQLVVFETDDVADEMPTALKVAGYTYTFYSDAACTNPVTLIGDLTNVYYQAPAVIRDGSIVTLKDQRNSMYVAVSADGFVRASKVLHPDCQWTLADRGDGTYNLVANDGSYLSAVTVLSSNNKLMTTDPNAPATGWQFVVDGDYYHIYNATNTTAVHMPNWGSTPSTDMHNNFVISWGSSTQNDNGSRFTIEAAPAGLFLVSDDTHEYWYNLTTHRDNTDYAVELPAVGKPIFGNSTIQNTNMAQQWKFTRHSTGGFNIVSRQDRSLFNREVSVGGGFGSSDAEATDSNGERGFFPGYQASTGKYVIIGGKTASSFQLHQGNWGNSYKIINYGSGTSTGDAYEFALTAAPTPVDNLTTGWYRIKVYKNPTLGTVAENALSGRYLYNQEVWSKLVNAQGGTGFFPFRVQEAAAQPADADADYYIHVEKDESGNVQLRSVNGHYVGTYGLANCNTPLLQVSDYTADQAQTNLLGSFDGDGYNFVGKYGTTDAYFVPYVTTYGSENSASSPDALDVNHTAVGNVWGTATDATGANMRYLLRPVDAVAVGLTEVSFTGASTYPLVDNDGTALPNPTYYIPSSKQHTAPRFRVTTTLAADVEEYYDGCTLFLPSGTQYATVLDQYMEGCKVHTFQINGDDRYVRSVPVGDANLGVLAIINTYILLMGEDAQAALHGVGPGYPSATHSARIRLEEINATTGKAFPGNSSTIDNYTDDDLIDIAAATDALFSETDIELPADGKSFLLASFAPDITYDMLTGRGAPLLLSVNNLDTTGDPDAAGHLATSGWNSFVFGPSVPTAADPTGENGDTQFLLPAVGNTPNKQSSFSGNVMPLAGFMVVRHIEDDKYAFTNIRGDYLAYRDADMAPAYNAASTYLRVRKLSVSDLPTNTCNLTPKRLYGKVYLAGSDGNGGEAIITLKAAMNDADYSLPFVSGITTPVCDAATGGSESSAFEFVYFDWYPGGYLNGYYHNENVSFNKVNDENYTTLYLPFPVELPTGVEAYVFSELEQAPYYQEGAVHKTRTLKTQTLTGVLPARTPAIISWDDYDNTPYTFKPAFTTGKESISDAVDDAINNSWLKGLLVNYLVSDVVTQLGLADATSIYVFNKQNDVPGFYKYSGSVLKGGRAFLVYPGDPEEVRGFVFQTSEGDMTSIGDLFDALNGIDPAADKTVYDLQGRRVANPQKGNVYIVGGKKVLMK